MIPVSSWSCLWPIHWSQVLSREWRCSWGSADRRCSNYIWVIDNYIAHKGATYIRDLTVLSCAVMIQCTDVSVNYYTPNIGLHWYHCSLTAVWQCNKLSWKKGFNAHLLTPRLTVKGLLKILKPAQSYWTRWFFFRSQNIHKCFGHTKQHNLAQNHKIFLT